MGRAPLCPRGAGSMWGEVHKAFGIPVTLAGVCLVESGRSNDVQD